MNSQELGNGVNLEVVLDRAVPLIDEIAEFIEHSGVPSLASILDDLRDRAAAPAPGAGFDAQERSSARERHAALQREITSAILRYRSDVEAPAAAILLERKAATPSAVRKVALGGRDAVVLAALEPDLSRLSKVPNVSTFALRVSPELSADAAHKYAGGAVLAGAHHNLISMYVGPYRPGMPSPGFYLVYDSGANSLTAVPQLPSSSISWFSHRAIGSMAAVLRHAPPGDFLLAELLTRNDSRGLPTNNATLCMWWSSGPIAQRWIQKNRVLPLPSTSEGYAAFCADTVFAVGDTSLCWVDLLMGVLICEDMLAPDPVFRFIPLPKELGSRPYHSRGRGLPEEYRSCNAKLTSTVPTIRFVSLQGYCEGWPADDVILTQWSLPLSGLRSEWLKEWSCRIGDVSLQGHLRRDTNRDHQEPLYVAKCPLLSVIHDDVVYLNLTARTGELEDYCVAVQRDTMLGASPGSGSGHKFVSSFSMFLDKMALSDFVQTLLEDQEQVEEFEFARCRLE